MQASNVGYYERPDQPSDQPTYDPPHDAACPFCGLPITEDDMRTIGIMYTGGAARSYFYRAHSTCHEAVDEQARQTIDEQAFAAVEAIAP